MNHESITGPMANHAVHPGKSNGLQGLGGLDGKLYSIEDSKLQISLDDKSSASRQP